MNKYRAILIAGPTASGKSQLALEIGEKVDGVVVNADSMQVYEDLDILTARPPARAREIVPHMLYGTVSGATAYSAGRYAKDVELAISQCASRGKMPIIVGGTGLYFRVLLEGLSPIPDVPPEIRQRWRLEADKLGAAGLHVILAKRDPEMAHRIAATDRQRVVRALEVLDATGRSLAAWQRIPGVPLLPPSSTVRIVINPDRASLYKTCDARFDAMLTGGALEEVMALAEKNYEHELPVMRALGVQPLLAYLKGRIDLGTAISTAKTDTRNYVKRQQTWQKRYMIAWNWISTQQIESLARKILPIID
ncbi:MAG: tRNA (adenosine(37)-N6)-dimethylallyltransferase MiaA [Hyphomicrobiaceae bacterium]